SNRTVVTKLLTPSLTRSTVKGSQSLSARSARPTATEEHRERDSPALGLGKGRVAHGRHATEHRPGRTPRRMVGSASTYRPATGRRPPPLAQPPRGPVQ